MQQKTIPVENYDDKGAKKNMTETKLTFFAQNDYFWLKNLTG